MRFSRSVSWRPLGARADSTLLGRSFFRTVERSCDDWDPLDFDKNLTRRRGPFAHHQQAGSDGNQIQLDRMMMVYDANRSIAVLLHLRCPEFPYVVFSPVFVVPLLPMVQVQHDQMKLLRGWICSSRAKCRSL